MTWFFLARPEGPAGRHARHDPLRVGRWGRLVRVERPDGPAVEYGYDPVGRLALRRVGEEETRYLHEGLHLLAELGPGERVRLYVPGPAPDEPLAYVEDGLWTFLHADDLGHVLAYSDAAGARVAAARFSPWGEPLERPAGRPLFFAGRALDPDLELLDLRARFYDPTLGRFLTPDPAFLKGGLNPYLYAEASPLDYVDPLGTWSLPGALHYYEFETPEGTRVVSEHTADPRAPGPHVHAGQPKGNPSSNHVDFKAERYLQVDGSHHYYYRAEAAE